MKQIPWADLRLGPKVRKGIDSLFETQWFSMGPRTKLLEEKIGKFIGVKHAIAVSNGTVAMDLSLKALGVGPGDEVIVPAMTYAATVSSVLYQGAVPVFADIEPGNFNLDPDSVKKNITGKTKCIMYIDYGGFPADSDGLKKISRSRGIPLLQDGAQSFGAEDKGQKLCKQGLLSTTSLGYAKLLTAIEGGMVFTDNDRLAADIRIRRNQGEAPGKKYIHTLLGTNGRITDLQSEIALEQFAEFPAILKKRRYIGEFYYKSFFGNKEIRMPVARGSARPSWFFAPILVENRDFVLEELSKAGIATRVAYPMPVYEQPFLKSFRKNGRNYHCPNAELITSRILNLPVFNGITDEQLSYITEQTLSAVARGRKRRPGGRKMMR